jgi:ectoine hydroxylase-related dioxygenase (phytanoyl-CoA dioxygenase family)
MSTTTDPYAIHDGVNDLTVAAGLEITELSAPPTPDEMADFETTGVGIVRSLLSPDEVADIRDVFQAAGDKGPIEGLADANMLDTDGAGRDEMLRRFPRMLHPHRHAEQDFGRLALRWMLDRRVTDVVAGLYGEPPVAAQSMYYFKGPGARGQALHQDNVFLSIRPGTCMAAWMAIDDCDEENGAMAVVPGSGGWDIICNGNETSKKNADEFWGESSLALPDGVEPKVARMKAGDVLFFNGSLVHGSYRNRSADRFRRSLIFHYAPRSCRQIAKFYNPLLDLDGSLVEYDASPDGGPCGGGGLSMMAH